MPSKKLENETITVLQLAGQADSGLTTLARLFIEAPIDESLPILIIENTPDNKLAPFYRLEAEESLAHLLEKGLSNQLTTDTRDWLIDECVVNVCPENPHKIRDLLLMGQTQLDQLSPKSQEWLGYTLPRLLTQYPLIVIDGQFSDLKPYLPKNALLRTLLLLKPQESPDEIIEPEFLNLSDADIILSQANPEDALNEVAKEKIQQGQWRFIGRIPKQGPEDLDVLYQAFKDCFLRLNLPIALS